MKVSRAVLVGVIATSMVALVACSNDSKTPAASGTTPSTSTSASAPACAGGSLTGAGSTFQQNMQQQWSKDFAIKCPGAQINYQGVGSGAGIEQFGSGTVNFAGSDVTMKPAEQEKANATCGSTALQIPITAGGVAIIYNVKGVKDLKLSAQTLAGIFQGKITKWDDAAIAAENPGTTLPSTPITVFHRSDGSGTTQVFSSFEAAVAGADWTLGTGKELSWTTGQGKKGSDGVTAGVKQTEGGITYAEVSFALANNLPTASVKGAGSEYVPITADTVSKALEAFKVTGTGGDLAGTIDYPSITTGYPISTVSYVIVCAKAKDAAKGALLKDYLTYAAGEGQQSADGLGFAPLPAALASQVNASIQGLS